MARGLQVLPGLFFIREGPSMRRLLNSHFRKRDDEWYTQAPLVKLIKEYVKLPDKIWCPCDGDKSEFTKILHPTKHTTDDYFKHDFRGFAVVTNPAFSTIRDFYKMLRKQGVKFALVAPQPLLTCPAVAPDIVNGEVKAILPINTEFNRPDGTQSKMNVFILTNLPISKTYDYPKHTVNIKTGNEPYKIKGSDYPCFDHTAAFRNSDFNKGWIPVTGIIQSKFNNFKVIDWMYDVYPVEGSKKFPRYLVEKKERLK
jgi:hypothetical protein